MAAAQPKIMDVVNSASHIPTGFPSAGVAPGGLFALIGTNLGPDPAQFAGFPLPTTDGVGGVSVQVAVGGATLDAIMVFAGPTQVSAILPSSTPTGKGTVTLNNNGATVTAPILVVASAPGLFAFSSTLGVDGNSGAPAVAFSTNSDGSMPPNPFYGSAQPGQTVTLVGTGVGAITSDETQPGITDVPNATLQVFVGNVPATNVSVARGSYPALPDPITLPTVPNGIAALDLIQFTVPDGMFGCIVSVVVQSGSFISNPVTIAISPDGGPCDNPNAADPGDTVTFNGTARVANISLTRQVIRSVNSGFTTELGFDTGVASFAQYDASAASGVPILVSSYSTALNLNPGSCNMQIGRTILGGTGTTKPPPAGGGAQDQVTYLDAGPALNLKGPAGKAQMKHGGTGFYTGSFGTALTIGGGPADGKLLLEPGDLTVDNGTGGVDVGSFTAPLTLSDPQLVFTNIDTIQNIDRSKGVTVKWKGGDPNGFVSIYGTSTNLSGTTPGSIQLIASFQCSERISAGQFTVPPFITSSMPATGLPQGLGGVGNLAISTYVVNRFSIPTFDLGLITFQVTIGTSPIYQ